MSSPALSPMGSMPSSPSSESRDLSVYGSSSSPSTSASSLNLPSPRHIILPQVPLELKCPQALAAFLDTLPLCADSGEYLLLPLSLSSHDGDNDGPVFETMNTDPLTALDTIMGGQCTLSETKWLWVEATDKPGYYIADDAHTSATALPADKLTFSSPNNSPVFTHAAALNIFAAARLRAVYALPLSAPKNASHTSTLYLLERPPFAFPPLGPLRGSEVEMPNNPFGPPTREEWRRLWAAWDLVTLSMIPQDMLHQKPIDLRHKCLFYIGHIPTFVDILLSKLLKEPYTEPKNFTVIFERGIDPHVDDPDHCHNHSEVPEKDEDWPTLASILAFRDRVRARLMRLYDDIDSGKRTLSRRIARVLQMTLEHEGFHVETLLYMLIQKAGAGTLPPPGFSSPPWAALAAQWDAVPPPVSDAATLGPAQVILGHDDSELDDLHLETTHDVAAHAFGWDNESPARVVEVGKFRLDWRPVTNGEFHNFWCGKGRGSVGMPASWRKIDGEIFVLTLHELVPLAIARHWPVLTSFDDLVIYAKSRGGRIPTEPELRLFLDEYDVGFEGGANVGFRNWHPVAATAGGSGQGGKGSNGGIWEWTSTAFDGHEGLAPTSIFPGYSTDFFDGKHQVVLGASYATMPRLAGRRTIRNFYQHNYPYPWVGARVAYDV